MVTSGLLPVELVAFQAEERNENIHLSWSTASEINNEGFEIERSTDGRNFDFIDFVYFVLFVLEIRYSQS